MGLFDWLFGADAKSLGKDARRKETRAAAATKGREKNVADRQARLLAALEANLPAAEKENQERIAKDQATLDRVMRLKALTCRCGGTALPVLDSGDKYRCGSCGETPAASRHDLKGVDLATAGDAKWRIEATRHLIKRAKDGLHISEEEMAGVCLPAAAGKADAE